MENQTNNIQISVTPEPYNKFIRSGTLLVSLSLLLASIALIFTPYNIMNKSKGQESVLIINQPLIRTWAGVSLVTLIILLILTWFLRKCRAKDYSHAIYFKKIRTVTIVLCFLAFPINWMRGGWGQWNVNPFLMPEPTLPPVTGSDGKRYYFLRMFAGMGSKCAIARAKEWHFYGQEFDLLAIDYMDIAAHAYLIRPVAIASVPKFTLYASDNGWVILITNKYLHGRI